MGSMSLPGFMRFSGSQRALNSTKACISSGPNIFGKQRGAGLAIAMLAGEGAAVLEDDVGGLVDEAAVLRDAFGGLEVEGDAQVDAALAEVAVHRRAIAVALDEREELAQIRAEKLGRDGGVFPAFAAVLLAGNEDAGAEAGLADVPDALGLLRANRARQVGTLAKCCEASMSACGHAIRRLRGNRRRTRRAGSLRRRAAA